MIKANVRKTATAKEGVKVVTFAKSAKVVQTMKSRREQKVCTHKQSNNGRENISGSKTAFRSAKASLSTVTAVQDIV